MANTFIYLGAQGKRFASGRVVTLEDPGSWSYDIAITAALDLHNCKRAK